MKGMVVGLGAAMVCWAATSASVEEVTAQQAVMRIHTDQVGCTIRVSRVNDFGAGYTPVPDVDPTLFVAAEQCNRTGSLTITRGYRVVIGRRTAEISLDQKTRISRSLQAATRYYYHITAGADQVSGSFVTRNIALGNTRNDPRFDRLRPGEYAHPTPPWGSHSKAMVDPHTGVAVRLMAGPGTGYVYAPANVAMAQAVAGTGWTVSGNNGGSYSGTSQGYLFLRPDATGIDTYQNYASLDWLKLGITLSGTAASVDVCLTSNRVTCSGATITQALTGSPTAYVFGTTAPILDAWKDSPAYPMSAVDLVGYRGSTTVSGTTVTHTSGDLFSLDWVAGSKITLDSTECNISSVTDQRTLVLTSACVAGGSRTYTAKNAGFLIRPHTAASSTIVAAGSTWAFQTTGQPFMGSYGAPRMCQAVAVSGGYYCADVGIADAYGEGVGIYWISPTDTRLIGLSVGTVGSTGLQSTSMPCSGVNEGLIWDAVTAGKFYCIGVMAADSASALFSVTYTGNRSAVAPFRGTALSPATTAVELADIDTLVEAYTAAYLIPYNRSFRATTNPGGNLGQGWKIMFQQSGKLILRTQSGGTDSPAWFAVYDPATHQIVAARGGYTGVAGKLNRFCGHHSLSVGGGDSTWMYETCNPDPYPYGVAVTSGTLTASMSACPTNAVQPEVAGQVQCSTVTVDTLTPHYGAYTLHGRSVADGDFFRVHTTGWDSETTRILVASGNTLTLLRGVRTEYGTNLNHTGALTLVVDPTAFKELWWNWADDPQGLGRTMAYGATMREDPHSSNCHQIFEAGVFIAGCGKSSIFGYGPGMLGSMMRDGDVPATFTASPYWVNWDGGFAGSTYQISTTYLESHPSRSQYLASAYEKKQWFDHRPLLGDPAIATSGNVTKVGTYLYRISAAATASMQYRMQGYIATAGEKVLVDVSPAVLADTTADAFKYCVVVVSGDCAVGSTSGQVYLNVPQAWAGYVVPSRFSALPFSIRDVALTQNTHTAASIVQAGSGGQDQIGAVVRRLTSGFAPYKVQSLYWNGRATPDGRRYYWKTDLLDAVAGALLIADVPAWPARDSMFRGDFIQIPIKMGGKPGDQVRIRFGYSENGHPESSFCHERQVACATDATGAQPFLWTDETQQWKACDSGCTISIPAISGRVLYYMVDRRNSGVSNSSPLDAIAVP